MVSGRAMLVLVLADCCANRGHAHRADWLHECGWGVFTHYLPLNRDAPVTDAAAWNAIVDCFNATHLAEQLEDIGACYYFITIGQDSGWYLGPNKAYDDFAGHDPPHTSRRDLISDIHAALAPKNIRLGVYLPYEAPMEDNNVSVKLNFTYLPEVSQDLLGGRYPIGRTRDHTSNSHHNVIYRGVSDHCLDCSQKRLTRPLVRKS